MTLTAMRPDAGRSNGRETSLLSEAQASGSIAVRLAVAEHREHDAQDHPLRLPLDFRRRSAPDPTRQRRRGRARRGRERPQVLENGRPLHIEVRRLGRRLVVSPQGRTTASVGRRRRPANGRARVLGGGLQGFPRGAAVVLDRLAGRRRAGGLAASVAPDGRGRSASRRRPILGIGADAAGRQAHVLAPGSLLCGPDVPEDLLNVVAAPGCVRVAHGPEFIDDRVPLYLLHGLTP